MVRAVTLQQCLYVMPTCRWPIRRLIFNAKDREKPSVRDILRTFPDMFMSLSQTGTSHVPDTL